MWIRMSRLQRFREAIGLRRYLIKPAICAALLLTTTHAGLAQVGFTTGSVYHNWMGFQRLAPSVGLDVSSQHFTNTFWWSSAAKTYVGDGWTVWEQAAAYWTHGAFGAGPAALVRHTANSQYAKTSLYPSFAVECQAAQWRVEGFVHFRDQWTQNHGRGASLMVHRELTPVSSRIGVTMRTGITIMKFSDGLTDPYGTVMQAGIVISPRRRH
jgi:hypothetical protein